MPRRQDLPPGGVSERGGDGEAVSRVLTWFRNEGRVLPWRQAGVSAWGVLVSEVMLQQTPVARVLPAWLSWMERWPSPQSMAEASAADAVRAWGRLGYPRRAQRLRECAIAIVRDHGGRVPASELQLRELPGVGEYTAAAVVAFAFGGRTTVLDTNVRRVIARAWSGEALPPQHLTRSERERAAGLVPEDPAVSVQWNVGAMELGALVCTARAPRCEACPLVGRCVWFAAGRPLPDTRARPAQSWVGSDRQVRGRVLALLRDVLGPVNISGQASLKDVEPGQLDRCLASLLADGLVRLESPERGTYAL